MCLAKAVVQALMVLIASFVHVHSTLGQGTPAWGAHLSPVQDLPGTIDGVTQGVLSTITCELLVEGNDTQPMNGTSEHHGSITRAHLSCTGGVLVVSLHPALYPFASSFKGVAVNMPKGSAKRMKSGMFGNTPVVYGHCEAQNIPSSLAAYLISICAEGQRVMFMRARLANLPQLPQMPLSTNTDGLPAASSAGGAAKGEVSGIGGIGVFTGHVLFYRPTFVHIPGAPLGDAGNTGSNKPVWNMSISVVGGLFKESNSVICGVMTSFVRTRFTNNQISPFGGAVMVMLGHAEFHQCVFDSNISPTLQQLTGGKAGVNILQSGLGGAVLASTQAGTHSCHFLFHQQHGLPGWGSGCQWC